MSLAGREAVLQELCTNYTTWGPTLRRTVVRCLLRGREEIYRQVPGLDQLVDDGIQNGLVVAIRSSDRYALLGGRENVRGWIYRVVINECRHALRAARTRARYEQHEYDARTSLARVIDTRLGPVEEASLMPTEEALRLADGLLAEALDDEQSRILGFLLAGDTQREIARQLGMSEPTVSRRVSDLREELAETVGDQLFDLLR
jgi:RNA polymerase sigma factor (sigma-70 family)